MLFLKCEFIIIPYTYIDSCEADISLKMKIKLIFRLFNLEENIIMAKLTKLERQIMEKFMALHRFRVAKTEEEREAAVKYAQDYCEKYKLNYKRQFSHLY